MKNTIEFIHGLQNASLDDPCSKLNAAALHRLREPHQAPLEINQPAIRFVISEYFALEHSAQDAYERIRRSAGHCFAGDVNEIPSYHQIECLIAEFTGVESIEHDMCTESCVAFTGPFSHLEIAPSVVIIITTLSNCELAEVRPRLHCANLLQFHWARSSKHYGRILITLKKWLIFRTKRNAS